MKPTDHTSTETIYVKVLENIADGVIALDSSGTITLLNPAAQNFTGFSERQSLGKDFRELFQSQQILLELADSAVTQGRPISDHENIYLTRSSLPPLPVSVSASPIFNRSGDQEGIVLIIRDLSRVRELEDAVRRADRLSILGTMAGGLAHEIKNPLGGIKGAAQLLAIESPDDNVKEYTRVMVREVDRVNRLIESLLDLGSPKPPEFTDVSLTRIIDDIILFQKEAHRKRDIEFLLNYDPSIPPIRGDRNLLTQLFLNLIKNGAEAIQKKGTIEVTTRVASEYHVNQPGGKSVPFIIIDIRDTGPGIPKDKLDSLFTPFFSTKAEGTGLGLPLCQKIVSEHQGFIKIKSSPGEGSRFSVYLPFIR